MQVTITLPASQGADPQQGSTLHAMVPSKATAAQLLQVEFLLICHVTARRVSVLGILRAINPFATCSLIRL